MEMQQDNNDMKHAATSRDNDGKADQTGGENERQEITAGPTMPVLAVVKITIEGKQLLGR